MSATAIVKRMIHKPTGTWYWVEVKLSWNIKYYSFDGGDHWHKSKLAAFNQAQVDGKLQLCDN